MQKSWVERNPNYKKAWRAKNPDKVKEENNRSKDRVKAWREKNKEVLRLKSNERRRKDKSLNGTKKYNDSCLRCRQNLTDGYIVSKLTRDSELTAKEVRKHPELIELKRIIIQTKRLIKQERK